jgi:hypothetical protein
MTAERFADEPMLGVVLDVSGLLEVELRSTGCGANIWGERPTSATPTATALDSVHTSPALCISAWRVGWAAGRAAEAAIGGRRHARFD